MPACAGCEKTFRDADIAPYQRNADGTVTMACRYCITAWIKMGALWASIPFWMRWRGEDQ